MKLAQDFRKQARDSLKGHWFIAIIASFIASLLGGLNLGGGSVNVELNIDETTMNSLATILGPEAFEMFLVILSTVIGILATVATIYGIIYTVIGGVIGIGYSKFNLNLIDGRDAKLTNLFENFNQWLTAFATRILVYLYTVLWTLLFIIPGIIAAYSYSMVHFVMAEHPEMTSNEAIGESKRLMKGNKWRLFCLQLSFIGWDLVGVLTLGIGYIWIIPYKEAAMAAFYRDIHA